MTLKSEASEMDFLKTLPAWEIIRKELQKEVDRTMKELRKSCKEDNQKRVIGYSRYMDGLEFAINLPDRVIDRGEL